MKRERERESRKWWKREEGDGVLMNMTDYNFTVWVVWGARQLEKVVVMVVVRRSNSGTGGSGRHRRRRRRHRRGRWRWRSGGGSRQAEWRCSGEEGREMTSKCCQSKKDRDGRESAGLSRARDSWRFDAANASTLPSRNRSPLASESPDRGQSDRRVSFSFFYFCTPQFCIENYRESGLPSKILESIDSINQSFCGLFD